MKLLDGYWPRFLAQYVPLPTDAEVGVAGAREESSPPAQPTSPPRTGLMDKVKDMIPEKLRW